MTTEEKLADLEQRLARIERWMATLERGAGEMIEKEDRHAAI
jgi:hypothetical protein